MAMIQFVAIQRAHGRTERRRLWQRWTPDLATAYCEPEPVRPELGVILEEWVLEHEQAIPTVWLTLLPLTALIAVVLSVACGRLL